MDYGVKVVQILLKNSLKEFLKINTMLYLYNAMFGVH